jgi:hypothetical protein
MPKGAFASVGPSPIAGEVGRTTDVIVPGAEFVAILIFSPVRDRSWRRLIAPRESAEDGDAGHASQDSQSGLARAGAGTVTPVGL